MSRANPEGSEPIDDVTLWRPSGDPISRANPEDRFRQAAEAEDGMPVSAGARVTHVHAAVAMGRGLYIDLSGVPEGERITVVAEIKALVDRASTHLE
jgi:hypothetical protein